MRSVSPAGSSWQKQLIQLNHPFPSAQYEISRHTLTTAVHHRFLQVLKKAAIVQKAKTAEHTRTERQVLEHIRESPFLVTLHYAFQTQSKLHLILGEYLPRPGLDPKESPLPRFPPPPLLPDAID